LLRYGAELSFEEAAAVAGVSIATVRERVSRALLRLRGALRRGYGGD
jgi:DNA-directed RNA polymerase specialized sigma24 family protein